MIQRLKSSLLCILWVWCKLYLVPFFTVVFVDWLCLGRARWVGCVCVCCVPMFFFFLVPSDTLYILPVYSGALFLAFLFIKSHIFTHRKNSLS